MQVFGVGVRIIALHDALIPASYHEFVKDKHEGLIPLLVVV